MATINTQSAGYQLYLTRLREIYALVRSNYGPPIKRMNKQQLLALYQADPIFKEIIDMARDVADVSERVGLEL